MKKIVGVCVAIAALAAGCSKSEEKTPTQRLTVTRTPASIIANGTSTSSIHVEGAQSAPITVTTRKGTFVESNATTVTVNALVADVTLRSCDSTLDQTCVGTAGISATDGAGTLGYSSVAFVSP